MRRGARDVTSGARASSVGTGGRCVRESASESGVGLAGRKGEEDLERGESREGEWAGGEDRG